MVEYKETINKNENLKNEILSPLITLIQTGEGETGCETYYIILNYFNSMLKNRDFAAKWLNKFFENYSIPVEIAKHCHNSRIAINYGDPAELAYAIAKITVKFFLERTSTIFDCWHKKLSNKEINKIISEIKHTEPDM